MYQLRPLKYCNFYQNYKLELENMPKNCLKEGCLKLNKHVF